MSQQALARRIGISTKSLNLIERDETADPRSSIVRKISDVLGVSTDWLLKGDAADEATDPLPTVAYKDAAKDGEEEEADNLSAVAG